MILCILCILCFTSSMSLTGFYAKDELKMAISATFQYLAIFRISGFFHRQTIVMLM